LSAISDQRTTLQQIQQDMDLDVRDVARQDDPQA